MINFDVFLESIRGGTTYSEPGTEYNNGTREWYSVFEYPLSGGYIGIVAVERNRYGDPYCDSYSISYRRRKGCCYPDQLRDNQIKKKFEHEIRRLYSLWKLYNFQENFLKKKSSWKELKETFKETQDLMVKLP